MNEMGSRSLNSSSLSFPLKFRGLVTAIINQFKIDTLSVGDVTLKKASMLIRGAKCVSRVSANRTL